MQFFNGIVNPVFLHYNIHMSFWVHNLIPFLIATISISLVLIAFQYVLGKDKKPEVIKVEYHLPENLTPAIAGTLIDESADIVDVIATIFDLERKGYIELVPVKKSRYFRGDDKDADILIKVVKKDLKGLNSYEAEIMNFILEQHSLKETVYLSDFGKKFAYELNALRKKIEDEATKLGYFDAPPYSVRNFFTAFYVILLIVAYPLIFKFGHLGFSQLNAKNSVLNPVLHLKTLLNYWLSIFLYTLIPIGGTFPLYLKLKKAVALRTKKGVEAWGKILGLREFIVRVERERLKKMAERDPGIFKKVLPYAIILGVAREWAEKVKKEYVEFPGWWSALSDAERNIIMENLELLSGRRRLVFASPDMIVSPKEIWDTLDKRN